MLSPHFWDDFVSAPWDVAETRFITVKYQVWLLPQVVLLVEGLEQVKEGPENLRGCSMDPLPRFKIHIHS